MDKPWKVDGLTDAELAEAYFNSWQSAHREVCRLEGLVAEKDSTIKALVSRCLFTGIISRGLACQYLGCGREELDEILDKVATNKQNITVYDADTLLKEEGDG